MFVREGETTIKKMDYKDTPKIIISEKAALKMHSIVAYSQKEVGWLGIVEEKQDNIFYIEDVYLFEQKVTATTTEISAASIMEFAEKIISADPVGGISKVNKIRMWGHSHVNFAVEASITDDRQMDVFQRNGCKYFIRLICNKPGNMKIDFFDYQEEMIYENVLWSIFMNNEYELNIISELKTKVTEVMPIFNSKGYKAYNKVRGISKEWGEV